MKLKLKYRLARHACRVALLCMFLEMIAPLSLLALTSGPSQPEFSSFEPFATTEMVDLFSGDFTYNIPLFELPGPDGGYPFNLAYHSGISMEQEAGWVGLGWSLNAGAINRAVRGYPDDFHGDKITKKIDEKTNKTFGLSFIAGAELFGKEEEENMGLAEDANFYLDMDENYHPNSNLNLNGELGVYYNNYKGIGLTYQAGFGNGIKRNSSGSNSGFKFGLGVNYDSFGGVSGTVNLRKGGFSTTYETGVGITDATMRVRLKLLEKSAKNSMKRNKRRASFNKLGRSFNFRMASPAPYIGNSRKGNLFKFTFKFGISPFPSFMYIGGKGFYEYDKIINNGKDQDFNTYGYMYSEKSVESKDEEITLLDFSRERDLPISTGQLNLPVPIFTNDYFSIVGQGVAGTVRPYRSDVGTLRDNKNTQVSNSFGLGIDAGYLPALQSHLGVNLDYTRTNSKNRIKVNSGTPVDEKYDFKSKEDLSEMIDYEPYYFKAPGELTSERNNSMNFIGGEGLVSGNLLLSNLFNEGLPDLSGVGLPDFNDFALPVLKKDLVKYSDGSKLLGNKNRENRKPRSNNVQVFTNEQILRGYDKNSLSKVNCVLSEFDVEYFDNTSEGNVEVQENFINKRKERKSHHIGGITTTGTNGLRYIYALPTYNKKQVEYIYTTMANDANLYEEDTNTDILSVGLQEINGVVGNGIVENGIDYHKNDKNTDQYINKTETPEYASQYLLTSVLGTDYIDITGDGLTDDDYGYWIKFNYKLVHDDYKWKAPYKGANYMPGLLSTNEDNKAQFMYGEKEVWFLKSVESKTHIAEFITSSTRKDGYGVNSFFQNLPVDIASSDKPAKAHELSEIKLYVKNRTNSDDNSLLKTIHFGYNHQETSLPDLCQGVDNADGTSSGKLTLHKVWFTEEKSTRGELNPYVFDYFENDPDYNPHYQKNREDMWGNNRDLNLFHDHPLSSNSLHHDYLNKTHPYVNNTNINASNKVDFDIDKSAWHLRKIKTPSGGELYIDYESDDYAYVQDNVAGQMFRVIDIGESFNRPDITQLNHNNNLDYLEHNEGGRTLYFELEEGETDITKYFKGLYKDQLFYSARVNLTAPLAIDNDSDYDDTNFEDIKGYGYVKDYGVVEDGNGQSVGYVVLKDPQTYIGDLFPRFNNKSYNPISLNSWIFLRNNLNKLIPSIGGALNSGGTGPVGTALQLPSALSDDPSEDDIHSVMGFIKQFLGQLKVIFGDFYNGMKEMSWGTQVDLNHFYIRLSSPDKVKYGGGVRVKQIVFNDNWNMDSGQASASDVYPVYGQKYEYTTKDKDGELISSGVATYEPDLGRDELCLRYVNTDVHKPLMAFQKKSIISSEKPINESYYPAPSVGYSKVTVKSLATAYEGDRLYYGNVNSINRFDFPTGINTTGKVEHEFYTAKEFPVITSETPIELSSPFTIPFGVSIASGSFNSIVGTQGYMIELNDMHGKPKKVSYFGQKSDSEFESKAYNYTEYIYHNERIDKNRESFEDEQKRLLSSVNVLSKFEPDSDNPIIFEPLNLGVDYEMYNDVREFALNSVGGGASTNADSPNFPFSIITGVTNLSYSRSVGKSLVTNKIISRTGILKKVISYEEGMLKEVESIVYDQYTGEPVLTKVKNEFDEDVFSYTHKGHIEYEGMQPAFKNSNIEVSSSLTHKGGNYYTFNNSNLNSKIVEGDEFIISDESASFFGTCTRIVDSQKEIYIEGFVSTGNDYNVLLSRSGKRNLLNTNIGNITSKSNPLIDQEEFNPELYSINEDGSDGKYIIKNKDYCTGQTVNNCVKEYLTSLNQLFQNTAFDNAFDNTIAGDPLTGLAEEYSISEDNFITTDNYETIFENFFIDEDGEVVDMNNIIQLFDNEDKDLEIIQNIQQALSITVGYEPEGGGFWDAVVEFFAESGNTLISNLISNGGSSNNNNPYDICGDGFDELCYFLVTLDLLGTTEEELIDFINIDVNIVDCPECRSCSILPERDCFYIFGATQSDESSVGYAKLFINPEYSGVIVNNSMDENIAGDCGSNFFECNTVTDKLGFTEISQEESLSNDWHQIDDVISASSTTYSDLDGIELPDEINCEEFSTVVLPDLANSFNLEKKAGLPGSSTLSCPIYNCLPGNCVDPTSPPCSENLCPENICSNTGNLFELYYKILGNEGDVLRLPSFQGTGSPIEVCTGNSDISSSVSAKGMNIYNNANLAGFNTNNLVSSIFNNNKEYLFTNSGSLIIKFSDDDVVTNTSFGGLTRFIRFSVTSTCGSGYEYVGDGGCECVLDDCDGGVIVTSSNTSQTFYPNQNLYKTGEKGIWKPRESYVYVDKRDYAFDSNLTSNTANLNEDGTFNEMPFFNWSLPEEGIKAGYKGWEKSSEITKYDKFSNPLEEKDAINNYSANRYSKDGVFLKASGVNMKHKEFINLDFETEVEEESNISQSAIIVDTDSHTGKRCISGGNPLIVEYGVDSNVEFDCNDNCNENCEEPNYIISFWAKKDQTFSKVSVSSGIAFINSTECNDNYTSESGGINFDFSDYPNNVWFLYEQEFKVPCGEYNQFSIDLDNDVLYDDLRIFPKKGNINTFVYDYEKQRIIAQLDENNYASLYYYDVRNNLSIIKKETEKGIRTIQSSQIYVPPND